MFGVLFPVGPLHFLDSQPRFPKVEASHTSARACRTKCGKPVCAGSDYKACDGAGCAGSRYEVVETGAEAEEGVGLGAPFDSKSLSDSVPLAAARVGLYAPSIPRSVFAILLSFLRTSVCTPHAEPVALVIHKVIATSGIVLGVFGVPVAAA